MTGIIQISGAFETLLPTTITLGTSGSVFGYRTTLGSFGSLAVTSWAGLTITDLYSDPSNNLIITFNSTPSVVQLRSISGGDSFGGSYFAPTSAASIVGNSFIWGSSLGYNPYASSGPTLNVTLRR